jgi:hypothetical protein
VGEIERAREVEREKERILNVRSNDFYPRRESKPIMW